MSSIIVWASLQGCALDRAAVRSDSQEQIMLHEAAQRYWDSLRWGFFDEAALVIEDEGARTLYQRELEASQQRWRLTEAEVLRVKVIVPPEDEQPDAQGRWRTGTVLTRTEGYTFPAQIVRVEDREQQWYRTTDGWWLERAAD